MGIYYSKQIQKRTKYYFVQKQSEPLFSGGSLDLKIRLNDELNVLY